MISLPGRDSVAREVLARELADAVWIAVNLTDLEASDGYPVSRGFVQRFVDCGAALEVNSNSNHP